MPPGHAIPADGTTCQDGMKILGLSVITNYGTGMVKEFHGHTETLQQADKAAQNLTTLIRRFVREI